MLGWSDFGRRVAPVSLHHLQLECEETPAEEVCGIGYVPPEWVNNN